MNLRGAVGNFRTRVKNAPRWLLVGLVAWIICGATFVASSSVYTLYYEHTVHIAGAAEISMYADASCTMLVVNGTTIDWGNLTAGTHTKTYWLKNTGNVNVTLSLVVQDLPSGWSCTWNREGYMLQPNEIVQIVITLSVPEGVEAGDYTFKTWIQAEEA